jgi:hypothetical protein
MKSTLKERIQEFSKTLEGTHFLHRERAIEQFITKELNARDVPYTLSDNDLANIHSYTVQESLQIPANTEFATDKTKVLTYAWTRGVCLFLRSRDMLYYQVKGE